MPPNRHSRRPNSGPVKGGAKLWRKASQGQLGGARPQAGSRTTGPQGQKALSPFLLRDPQSYCFSPREAEEERRQRQHKERTTPLTCGNVPGSNVKDHPARSPGDRHTTCSYRQAIQRACD